MSKEASIKESLFEQRSKHKRELSIKEGLESGRKRARRIGGFNIFLLDRCQSDRDPEGLALSKEASIRGFACIIDREDGQVSTGQKK